MGIRRFMAGVLFFLLFFSLSSRAGGNRYTLSYKATSDLSQDFCDISGTALEPQKKSTLNLVKEPKYVSEKPLYFQIPLGKQKFSLVLDEAKGTGTGYDTLYFDQNGNNDLTDDPAYPVGKRWDSPFFGPVMVLLKGEKEETPYHFGFHYHSYKGNTYYSFFSNCVYTGKVKIGDKTYLLAVIDYTGNGLFDDLMTEDESGCDRILIDLNDSNTFEEEKGECLPYARHILVDGRYYTPDISSDGCRLELTEAFPKMGFLKAKQENFTAGLVGPEGFFLIKGRNFKAEIPAGRYQLRSAAFESRDSSGVFWNITGQSAVFSESPPRYVAIKSGQTIEFNFGPPLNAEISYREVKKGESYQFEIKITGQAGELYADIRKNGTRVAPAVKIKSVEGTYSTQENFRYG